MTHLDETTELQERAPGKTSFLMIAVYVILFGAWLAFQLHK